jgi:hypothetical protein
MGRRVISGCIAGPAVASGARDGENRHGDDRDHVDGEQRPAHEEHGEREAGDERNDEQEDAQTAGHVVVERLRRGDAEEQVERAERDEDADAPLEDELEERGHHEGEQRAGEVVEDLLVGVHGTRTFRI